MMVVVIGPNGSGKSVLAESKACALHDSLPTGSLIYLATMIPDGTDGKRRIERHRSQRKDHGFLTVESPLAGLILPDEQAPPTEHGTFGRASRPSMLPIAVDDTVLLEDVSNLVANVMFTTHAPDPVCAVLTHLDSLRRSCAHLVAVTIGGLTVDPSFSEETLAYMAALDTVNEALVSRADQIIRTNQPGGEP